MEYARAMRELSSAEDLRRLIETSFPSPSSLEARAVSLRLGQTLVARLVATAPRQRLFIEYPTGYGKTLAAALAAVELRNQGLVKHVLILVPSDEQRSKWLAEAEDLFGKLSDDSWGAFEATEVAALSYFRRGDVRIFVGTIQSCIGKAGKFIVDELLGQSDWLVIVDEAQYYAPEAEGQAWTAGLRSILERPGVKHWLAMSATPLRRNNKYGFLGSPNIIIPIKVAIDEGALRPPRVRAEEYVIDIGLGDDNQDNVQRVKTSDIEQWASENGGDHSISAWEMRKRVRYDSRYVSQILAHAAGILRRKETQNPGQNQLLVFAMSVRHAKHLAEAFNNIEPGFADYIGDTDDPEAARSTDENVSVMQRFKANELPCLVQVAKAGVGFDNIRCSVLLFLNIIGPSPLLAQFIGRGLRRNLSVDPAKDICDIITSMDHPGLSMMLDMQEEIAPAESGDLLGDDAGGTGSEGGPRLTEIPDWFLIEATFEHAQIFTPYDNEVREQVGRIERSQSVTARQLRSEAEGQQVELFDLVRRFMEEERRTNHEQQSVATRHAQGKALLNQAFSTVLGNVLRLRSTNNLTIDSSQRGEIAKRINTAWLREGGRRAGEATIEDMQAKYDWLQRLNRLVQTGTLPGFLNP